jgi:acyl-coenzyme A synthetase/AMP-(fatty) acid ligase
MKHKTSQPFLLHKHSVISCALQCGWHTGMYLASAPPRVFGGQGIAYNDSGVVVVQAASPN